MSDVVQTKCSIVTLLAAVADAVADAAALRKQ